MTRDDATFISPIDEIVEEARAGRMFILVDDEDRENEGDLVVPASHATPEIVNFMARFGRGLICLALEQDQVDRLGLHLMPQRNASRHQTAFTVSIEARDGITTGISAADRAQTVAVAIDPASSSRDITTPGHIFPLLGREGGVLVRAGHTEAAIDISRMAGLAPSGLICEIMNDDGSMARMPDLIKFAQFHGLKVGTIADLIAYRRRTERLVKRHLETTFVSRYGGEWRLVLFINTVEYAEHIALIYGDVEGSEPVLVRMHALSVFDDVLGATSGSANTALEDAMRQIAGAGRGVVVLIREPRATALSERLQTMIDGSPPQGDLRDYGVGAQILVELGVREMVLLSSTKRSVIGLEGYGLSIVDQMPIVGGEGTD